MNQTTFGSILVNIVQVNTWKQNSNTAENIYSHVHVYTQSSIPMYMHSCLQLTSITFCKKKKCPTLKIIHTSCVKINNKQMNSIKNKMYTFSFQSHLVIWTAHAYSFMMLFLTSSNYTEKNPTILNMQNPFLNKKILQAYVQKIWFVYHNHQTWKIMWLQLLQQAKFEMEDYKV